MPIGKLSKKIFIEGTITTITGLHIGSSNIGMSIGGADAVVLRNPISNKPYIPGSSLKGKMRSLIEKLEGEFEEGNNQTGPLLSKPDHFICRIFGTVPKKLENNRQPTSRLIVRDCELTLESAEKLTESRDTDMPYTEVKTEVLIDRITSAATPRQIERVPAGAVFAMKLILNIYEGDNENELVQKVFEALCLVQNDYLGGKGTRGSGEVKISITGVKYKDKTVYESAGIWKEYQIPIPVELKQNEIPVV
ncbi:MAG: type III-A CRISPR-associated RAMP protein Csm3 [Ignavibacteria bacterium]|jgi:CRISPR-associated protein Csm3|nr:type III-A CRISPR-associated RAMP protein Csm3 [Ignavibacteria bacterium]MCU7504469.1 type III-A CRISPR-associated RAMP protein Csm3 [Ignavibacteria bacterium]MCU7517952.1 type III-A CRISPR-associated RAMP protein Csm3 [Ignavibacteria bacterium]